MVRTRSSIDVVCDAGPIIHLNELGCLELFCDFREVFVPGRVVHEVLSHQDVSFSHGAVQWRIVTAGTLADIHLRTAMKVYSLDAGEIAALSLLEEKPDALFLTDDTAARLVGLRFGFRVHGTIGILVRAIRRNYLQPEEVIQILQYLPSTSTLHIKPSLLENIIARIRKEIVSRPLHPS